jgi:hypothetical protein
MSRGYRLLWVGGSLAGVAFVWISLVQAQQVPQQFPSPDARQSQLRDRLAGAVQRVQAACQSELRNFCSTVTPGEGRVLLCMQAHEDKISKGCEMALFEASRNLQQATRRVERLAEACWNDIQAICAASSSVGQCISENRAALSPPCRAVVAATLNPQPAERQRQTPATPQRNVVGLPIYSADGARLGEITGVQVGPDGRLQAVHAELGYMLGLGASAVLISPDDLELKENHAELPMQSDEIRAVLMQQPQ